MTTFSDMFQRPIARVSVLGCAILMLVAPLESQAANDFFWPEHRESVEFKVKAHAIRGRLKLTLGNQTTIGDKTYQELIVETQPERLPKQYRAVFIRGDKDGVYSRYSTSADDKEVQNLALPATVGKTWQTFDEDGNPSQRKIKSITDCEIKGAKFKACVEVSFEAPGGAAVAVFAHQFGEIVNSRVNGFNRRTIDAK